MFELASDNVTRISSEEINTLPLLLVAKLSRHPHHLSHDTTQRHVAGHSCQSLRP